MCTHILLFSYLVSRTINNAHSGVTNELVSVVGKGLGGPMFDTTCDYTFTYYRRSFISL